MSEPKGFFSTGYDIELKWTTGKPQLPEIFVEIFLIALHKLQYGKILALNF